MIGLYQDLRRYSNNLLPTSFSSYFDPLLNSISAINNDDFVSIIPRTNIGKCSIKYQGDTPWKVFLRTIVLQSGWFSSNTCYALTL